MKYFITPLLLSFILAVAPASAQTQGIAAIVNDDVISAYDLNARVKLLMATSNQEDTPEIRKRLSKQVLNRLIDEKLKMQEAKRLNINISRQAINNAYRDLEKRNKLPHGGLDEFLTARGVDKLALLDQIEADMSWGSAVSRSLNYQIQIGDDEIDEIIAEINASKGTAEYLLAEIFLPVDNPKIENEVFNMARRLVESLKAGASFQALARNYSQSASAAIGGDLGWVRAGQLAAEIDSILPQIGKGEASVPIRTIAGFYIILNRDNRTGKGLTSPDQKVRLQQAVFPLPAGLTAGQLAEREQDVKARTAGIEGCENLDILGQEQGSPLSGSLGEVRVDALPDAIRNAIEDLDIGKASVPLASGDGLLVLMVCERTGTSALKAARKNIKNRLTNQRLDIAARRRLRDLRNTAFVDIRI